eukprot:CAMPEP_0197824338 /NCGR_PEP_ID=MMETSP1437-20131217/1598_1 /TAXON_ID=49252 ORGANISM="Eucampia antarctica, Strain CCMP1452" /NCGR_SAMPLE_ID=MMETSP1437 /ASSEMBLY_ACC=CAM_ASM_001096 /LENGTH=158 /DNA_ID=CAMNT_0043423927 /DNA_START=101 /DNA_END=577 /DNA_ORIENTATION=-
MSTRNILCVLCLATLISFINAFAPNHAFLNVGCSTPFHVSNSKPVYMGFSDDVSAFFKKLSVKATASHILIRGGAEAESKLLSLKKKIGDNPLKFAEAAMENSSCPSGKTGGSLGEFGPGQMVKEFDQVVFAEDVGVVHGPIQTQFGYHLILISDRTE